MKKLLILILLIFLSGCAILKKPELKTYKDMRDYKYALLAPTQTLSNTYGWGIGYYSPLLLGIGFSSSESKEVNPADVIAGMLIKKGYIILSPQDAKREGTFIVKYGAGEQRWGGVLGASIQMIDAQSQELLFTCFAEGRGYTDVSAFRRAITRCLKDFK